MWYTAYDIGHYDHLLTFSGYVQMARTSHQILARVYGDDNSFFWKVHFIHERRYYTMMSLVLVLVIMMYICVCYITLYCVCVLITHTLVTISISINYYYYYYHHILWIL